MTVLEKQKTLVVPMPTMSQNVWGKLHWAKRREWSNQALPFLRTEALRGGRGSAPCGSCYSPTELLVIPVCHHCKLSRVVLGRVEVKFHRVGARMLDYGNLVGGAKPLLDLLVKLNLIRDDAPAYITESYSQSTERDRRKHRTAVTLQWKEQQP